MHRPAEGSGSRVLFAKPSAPAPAFLAPLLALTLLILPTTARAAEAVVMWCQASLGVMEVVAVGRSGGAPGLAAGDDCGRALAALLTTGFQIRNVSAGMTLGANRPSVTYSLTK